MFKTILVAIDVNHPDSSKKALAAASSMAKASGGVIHALGVVPDMEMPIVAQYFPADFENKAKDKTSEELEALVGSGAAGATTHVVVGRIYDQIVAKAKEVSADLIVIGAHAEGVKDFLVGSNARKVVAHAPQSVLVVRG